MQQEKQPRHLAQYLKGSWQLTRLIGDYANQETGQFVGRAEFVGDLERLEYHESGAVKLGHFRGDATRAYQFTFPKPHVAFVKYPDGKPFFVLECVNQQGFCQHHCGDDNYQGRLRIINDHEWQMTWVVRGPKKSYLLESHYLRANQN